MKGIDIIEAMNVKECNSVDAATAVINASHMALLEIHGRALACPDSNVKNSISENFDSWEELQDRYFELMEAL